MGFGIGLGRSIGGQKGAGGLSIEEQTVGALRKELLEMTTMRDVEANRRAESVVECQRLRKQLSETLRARKDAEARALQQELDVGRV